MAPKETATKGIVKTAETDLLEAPDDSAGVIIPGVTKGRKKLMTDGERQSKGMKLEMFVSLDDGDQVEGIYIGEGGAAQVNSRNPDKTANVDANGKQKLPTYRIQTSATMVVRLLGSANLQGSLGGLAVGTHVIVNRLGKDKKSNVTMFAIETGAVYDLTKGWPLK